MSALERVWYFAYGANMETATFCGRRGIEFARALPARLFGWRLLLDKPPLLPIGEAFANIVAEPGAAVLGVAYEITADELAHVELTEGVLIGNYQRAEVSISPLADPAVVWPAYTLASDRRDPSLRPSQRYMACLIAGAVEHGLPAEWIEMLRAVSAGPDSPEAIRLRSIVDDALRRRLRDD
jgi:hypothetical protein